MTEKRRRNAMVSVRLSPVELRVLQLRAEAAGKAMSAFLRDCALDGAGLRCQHEGCAEPGAGYWRMGNTVSNGPVNYSSSGPPVEVFRFCGEHALKVLGVAFGRAA